MSAGDHQVVVCLKKRKSTEEPTNQTRFFQHSSFFFNHRSFPTLNNQNSHCTWPIEACVEKRGQKLGDQGVREIDVEKNQSSSETLL